MRETCAGRVDGQSDQPLRTIVPRSGLAASYVTAIASFNQSLSPKSSHAAIRLGWELRLGRSVKARRFADREQGEFCGRRPGALASDTPLVEVKALLRFGIPYSPRSHGEQEDRLSCTMARAALPSSWLGVVGRLLPALPLLLPPTGQGNFTGGSRPPNSAPVVYRLWSMNCTIECQRAARLGYGWRQPSWNLGLFIHDSHPPSPMGALCHSG